MLRRVEIAGFRCFKGFATPDLGRINVIVGKNNAGKTCLLEGIELLASGSAHTLGDGHIDRGEYLLLDDNDRRQVRVVPDIRCAFFDRKQHIGAEFVLRSESEETAMERQLRVRRIPTDVSLPDDAQPSSTAFVTRVASEALEWSLKADREYSHIIPLLPSGGMMPTPRKELPEPIPTRFIRTSFRGWDDIAELWGPIAATEYEERVVNLLQIVEPEIERIAAAPGPRGGIFVRLRGTRDRIPLGSFGDGTIRLFSLACNLIAVQHGLLLIDEIDTGLHVSTLRDMWSFLAEAARLFDVQIFATTHSDDCLRGLADFLRGAPETHELTRLYRIERGARTMTAYSSEEIVQTAEANIEVR